MLTYAEREVEQPHADVEAEEQDGVGHFAEHENIPDVLLHGDCNVETGIRDGARFPQKAGGNFREGWIWSSRCHLTQLLGGGPISSPHPPHPPDSLERRFFIITMALRNMRISTSLWHREGTA